jgi:hypothetical protein
LNTKIDESFVPMASVPAPEAGKFEEWKKGLVAELKRVSFGYFPETIPAAKRSGGDSASDQTSIDMQSEQGIQFKLRFAADAKPDQAKPVLLVILNEEEAGRVPEWISRANLAASEQALVYCEPRGIGATRWTKKDPPNYVARSHVLLGRTVDTGRVWDVISAAKYLAAEKRPVQIAGKGAAGLIGAYAAIFAPEIASVTILSPPPTHMDNAAPQFLNVLRVCDVPDSLGLIAPRPLNIIGASGKDFSRTADAYDAAEAKRQFALVE